jgi:hypothetical protein
MIPTALILDRRLLASIPLRRGLGTDKTGQWLGPLVLYQRPQLVTGLAHSRRVMEAIRSGMAMSAFQAWQQVSTIAA